MRAILADGAGYGDAFHGRAGQVPQDGRPTTVQALEVVSPPGHLLP
jgi:hypothetical protein